MVAAAKPLAEMAEGVSLGEHLQGQVLHSGRRRLRGKQNVSRGQSRAKTKSMLMELVAGTSVKTARIALWKALDNLVDLMPGLSKTALGTPGTLCGLY